MLAPASTIVRLSLHVLAATIWVGGQFTLAGLVPTLRRVAPGSTAAAARQFARLAWPAYLVLIATGIWNMVAVNTSDQSSAWKTVLGIKIGVVALSGVAAYAHERARTTPALAVWGALTSLFATTAVILGVALAG
jgi:putative copper export protein